MSALRAQRRRSPRESAKSRPRVSMDPDLVAPGDPDRSPTQRAPPRRPSNHERIEHACRHVLIDHRRAGTSRRPTRWIASQSGLGMRDDDNALDPGAVERRASQAGIGLPATCDQRLGHDRPSREPRARGGDHQQRVGADSGSAQQLAPLVARHRRLRAAGAGSPARRPGANRRHTIVPSALQPFERARRFTRSGRDREGTEPESRASRPCGAAAPGADGDWRACAQSTASSNASARADRAHRRQRVGDVAAVQQQIREAQHVAADVADRAQQRVAAGSAAGTIPRCRAPTAGGCPTPRRAGRPSSCDTSAGDVLAAVHAGRFEQHDVVEAAARAPPRGTPSLARRPAARANGRRRDERRVERLAPRRTP